MAHFLSARPWASCVSSLIYLTAIPRGRQHHFYFPARKVRHKKPKHLAQAPVLVSGKRGLDLAA